MNRYNNRNSGKSMSRQWSDEVVCSSVRNGEIYLPTSQRFTDDLREAGISREELITLMSDVRTMGRYVGTLPALYNNSLVQQAYKPVVNGREIYVKIHGARSNRRRIVDGAFTSAHVDR